nr:unnamed protein product [Callosobruchus chinensis]
MMPGKRPETKAVKTKEKTAAAPTYKTHAPQTLRNRKSSKYQYEGRSRRKRIAEDGTKSLELLRGVCTITKPNKTVIDSTVLRLHSNSTVVLLITFSIAVTTRQYVGNPIDCMEIRGIPEDILNSYCWIHSTYVIIETVKESKQWGHYPGVHYTGKSPVRLTKYYQWAMLFYAPRWLWKSWEGGKIHALMMDLDVAVCTEIEKKQKKKLMIDYLWENLRYHNWWAYKYYFCEVLALVNVVGQMFLMNRFLTAPS